MAAESTSDNRWVDIPPGMKLPLIISAVFHIALLIVILTGLPYFKKDPDDMPRAAVPVEILPISEMTTTTKPPVKSKPTPEKEIKEKPPEKPPMPPKSEPVQTPPEPKEKPKEKPKEPEKPKVQPKPKAKPVVPPPPTEKLEEPEPPKEKPKEEKPVEEKQQQDFDSLLKNLQDSKPQVEEDVPVNKNAEAPAPSPLAAMSESMTMSELDALRQQLSRCWSIQAGARYADNLVVEVRVTVSPERRVLSASVVDQWRYNQDSYFRAAADSAIRAMHSPQCETLNLNPDKYDMWKDMIVEFDPSEML